MNNHKCESVYADIGVFILKNVHISMNYRCKIDILCHLNWVTIMNKTLHNFCFTVSV